MTPQHRRVATVLVLDDDPTIVAFIESALTRSRFSVIGASTLDAARQLLATRRVDIALVDITLESESGWDLLVHIREDKHYARLPIAMITASDELDHRQKSLRLGADRYLVKPLSASAVKRTVDELLSSRDDLWWALSILPEDARRVRDLLYDSTSDVATLAVVVDELRASIDAGEQYHIYCFELEPLFRVGERHLWETFDHVRREFVRALRVVLAKIVGGEVTIATSHPGGSDFYCFARAATHQSVPISRLEIAAREMLSAIDADPAILDEIVIFVGAAKTHECALYTPRILYDAVREAKDGAERRETKYRRSLSEALIAAVREKSIRTVFQPVFSLGTRKIFGYEALSRGPKGSEIENPEVIFDLARDLQLVWDVEALCIENVAPLLSSICDQGVLFFNLESHFIQQLHQKGMQILEPLLTCNNFVVIEVTERSAIRDYGTFRRTLYDLKKLGFRIAIDDCGSGYATLEAVAELQPEFLKVGHSLFQNVHTDPIRRRLVELVARCAESIGAQTIAEAIETEEQMAVCADLGIPLGQGYLLAKPAPWPKVTAPAPPDAGTAGFHVTAPGPVQSTSL